MPGRSGSQIRFHGAARRRCRSTPFGASSAALITTAFAANWRLVSAGEAEARRARVERPRLADAWAAAVATLPPDWSDLHAELELTSTDQLERAALLLAPLNPTRFGGTRRCDSASRAGSGTGHRPGWCAAASSASTKKAKASPASFRILRVLSDTDPVSTQGPVWYVEGKAV